MPLGHQLRKGFPHAGSPGGEPGFERDEVI
jgi:hypothetical protein